ncbi:MAG: hypothetical protein OWR52_08060 [Acidibacillus sp.]|nr:hypothetical protein [Sulfoacidibacillus ferrooxidans]MCY0893444.1 hypothetical protein [Acidibacillus sp.]
MKLSIQEMDTVQKALHSAVMRAQTDEERKQYQAVLDRIYELPPVIKDGFLYDFDDDAKT